MQLVPALLLVLFIPFTLACSFAAPACADPALRLNEFVAGPARDWDGNGTFSSRDDEWVEVVNTGSESIVLDGFLITDGDDIPRFALAGTLGAGERRLIFGRESYDWERATGHPAYGLSLGNSGDGVSLWQVVGPDTVLVDTYTYRSHEAAADRAVGRTPDGGPWQLYDGLNPYTGTALPKGNGCNPTPGAANICTVTPTVPTSWGRLKAIFR
jgi:hypothetical protein